MSSLPSDLASKTVVVTGGANGIGAAIVQGFARLNANIVIADLPSAASSANNIINAIIGSGRAIFVPVDITNWSSMVDLFKTAKLEFGRVDIVVANAGIMETKPFFDFDLDPSTGVPKDEPGLGRVIDVNLKGTMNTLRLAMFHMQSNPLQRFPLLDTSSSFGNPASAPTRGSIVLISSTSGFFGGTSVVSYIASKHGVIGLLRASQSAARKFDVQVNAVAPFITPTFITEGYSEKYRQRGLPLNTPADVADAVVKTSLGDGGGTARPSASGRCYLVAGGTTREVEGPRDAMIASYMGEEVKQALTQAQQFFEELGGYPLPQARV